MSSQPEVPAAGTALPPAGDQPAQEPAATTSTSSVEKVEHAIQSLLSTRGPAVQAFLSPLISSLNLPKEASVLDQLLAEGARYLLSLRSDGTEALTITTGADTSGAGETEIPAQVQEAVQKVTQAVSELVQVINPAPVS